MSRRKINRVPVRLDDGKLDSLRPEEIAAILRAADELIGQGGRSLLVKILKGSKEKKVLELELDRCPVYGYYRELTMEAIGYRVDWMIRHRYLLIQYDYRLPVLVFSEIGWEIEKKNYAREMYERFCLASENGDESIIEILKEHTNREVVLIVLDLLKENGSAAHLPMLEKWKAVEVKKIRSKIGGVIGEIRNREQTQQVGGKMS